MPIWFYLLHLSFLPALSVKKSQPEPLTHMSTTLIGTRYNFVLFFEQATDCSRDLIQQIGLPLFLEYLKLLLPGSLDLLRGIPLLDHLPQPV